MGDMTEAVKAAAIAAYPEEACGLVIRVGLKSIYVSCKNVSPTPRNNFIIDPKDYAAAADRGEVIGVWHTHVEIPNTPSDADLAGCENSDVPWYIYSICKQGDSFEVTGPRLVEPSGFKMALIGRPYVFGVFDCWTLVRDYYRREMRIELGEYPRIDRFWAKGYNFFGDNWAKEGFNKLVDQEPKVGDLFLIQTDNYDAPNHIAVYVEKEIMLHHCHGRLSRRETYGGYWYKHTTHHLRRKELC